MGGWCDGAGGKGEMFQSEHLHCEAFEIMDTFDF